MVLAGCARRPEPAPAAGLAGLRAHLAAVQRLDGERRRGAIAGWQVPRARWGELVTPAYRDAYPAYVAQLGAATAELGARLGADGAVATRWQYADDRSLAPAQRRERLALPVGRPGAIATVDGRDLPAVFVFDRGAWRALVGLDALTQAAIAAHEPACAAAYAAAGDPGPCMDLAAPVAIAALGRDRVALALGCRRLTALAALGCGGDRGSVAAPPPTP